MALARRGQAGHPRARQRGPQSPWRRSCSRAEASVAWTRPGRCLATFCAPACGARCAESNCRTALACIMSRASPRVYTAGRTCRSRSAQAICATSCTGCASSKRSFASGLVEGRLHLLAYGLGAGASGMTFIDSEIPALRLFTIVVSGGHLPTDGQRTRRELRGRDIQQPHRRSPRHVLRPIHTCWRNRCSAATNRLPDDHRRFASGFSRARS